MTAVVTAHNRPAFLPRAVRSALLSGADEIVVVRNFAGPIDGCEGRYLDVRCDRAETNEKEAAGLERASGDLVAFLDDDDLWEPAKAARVREVFGSGTDLVYLCHAHHPVDADGRPVVASHSELADKHPEKFDAWDGRNLSVLARSIWPGNNSSTVVRRQWALGWVEDFRRAGWGADLFWLVAGLLGPGRARIVPDDLTALRLHSENMSHQREATPEEFQRRFAESNARFARSLAALESMARARPCPTEFVRFLSAKATGFRFLADLERRTAPRRAAVRVLTTAPGLADPGVRRAAIAALLSPGWAREALYRASRNRWRLGGTPGPAVPPT